MSPKPLGRPTGVQTGNSIQIADVVDVDWPGWKGRGIVLDKRWQNSLQDYIYVVRMVECENRRLLYTNGGFYRRSLTLVTDP